MDRALPPIHIVASPAIRWALKDDLRRVAARAVEALLRNGKGLEVSLQQIEYRELPIAFSSRIGRMGDLVIELDMGSPALGRRVFLEEDYRKAAAATARSRAANPRRRRG